MQFIFFETSLRRYFGLVSSLREQNIEYADSQFSQEKLNYRLLPKTVNELLLIITLLILL